MGLKIFAVTFAGVDNIAFDLCWGPGKTVLTYNGSSSYTA
jgi:hypothetical protein